MTQVNGLVTPKSQYDTYVTGLGYPATIAGCYEGGFDAIVSNNVPTNALMSWHDSGNVSQAVYCGNRDGFYDPSFKHYYKAFLALQQPHYTHHCHYSADLGYNYSADWLVYGWAGQQPGAGDGSDGNLNNTLSREMVGYPTTIFHLHNQDAVCVSVAGQGHNEWVNSLAGTTPTQLSLYGTTTGVLGLRSSAFTILLDQPDSSAALTANLTSSNGSDTFQSGGLTVTTLTIGIGATSSSFYLTPSGTAGARTITVTIPALSLTYVNAPLTFTANSPGVGIVSWVESVRTRPQPSKVYYAKAAPFVPSVYIPGVGIINWVESVRTRPAASRIYHAGAAPFVPSVYIAMPGIVTWQAVAKGTPQPKRGYYARGGPFVPSVYIAAPSQTPWSRHLTAVLITTGLLPEG